MVLLHLNPIPVPQTLLSSSSSRLPSALTPNASCCSLVSRVVRSVNLQAAHFNGIKRRRAMVVKASSAEIDGAEPPPSETETKEESSLSVEELPMESKLELKLQQKIKMRLAKKIRLRRKRLVRKRQLRKKGRWPPSKMNKNKNV